MCHHRVPQVCQSLWSGITAPAYVPVFVHVLVLVARKSARQAQQADVAISYDLTIGIPSYSRCLHMLRLYSKQLTRVCQMSTDGRGLYLNRHLREAR